MSLSPYETHASSQNSLSSSQSHALLMIRPERDTETHTVVPSVTAGCLCERVYEHTSLGVCVCVFVTEQVGWILSVISCVNCERANQKADDDRKAAIGPCSLPSSWQQLSVTSFHLQRLQHVCYLFLVAHNNISHVWCHHFKRLLTQCSCLQWTLRPASTHSELLQRVRLNNTLISPTSIQTKTRQTSACQLGKVAQDHSGAIWSSWKN